MTFMQDIECGAIVYGSRNFLVVWKSYVVMPHDQYPRGARCRLK